MITPTSKHGELWIELCLVLLIILSSLIYIKLRKLENKN